MNYYHRTPSSNTDGSPIFTNAEDRAHELETRILLEHLWNCEIKPFGLLSPVDFFALQQHVHQRRVCNGPFVRSSNVLQFTERII